MGTKKKKEDKVKKPKKEFYTITIKGCDGLTYERWIEILKKNGHNTSFGNRCIFQKAIEAEIKADDAKKNPF